jgi:hypothetical protein
MSIKVVILMYIDTNIEMPVMLRMEMKNRTGSSYGRTPLTGGKKS